jgi:hypothetical protein
VFTGANQVLLIREARARIGGLASIRSEGAYSNGPAAKRGSPRDFEAIVEAAALRPLVRGADIAAWRYETDRLIVWPYTANGGTAPVYPRLARYLSRHELILRNRSGARVDTHPGAAFRVTADTLRPKVAWHDLADDLNAVALPATIRSSLGQHGHLVPLNTVYFLPTDSHEQAWLLAAYLNSLPVRMFARVVAERAKDARFRFFAWTVSALPLPPAWNRGRSAVRLCDISEQAHANGAIDPESEAELNDTVCNIYGLDSDDRQSLLVFDRWLKGLE